MQKVFLHIAFGLCGKILFFVLLCRFMYILIRNKILSRESRHIQTHFLSSTFLWKKVEPKPLTAQGAFLCAGLSRMAPRLSPSQPAVSLKSGLLGFRHAPRAAGRQSGDKPVFAERYYRLRIFRSFRFFNWNGLYAACTGEENQKVYCFNRAGVIRQTT